MEGLSIIIPVFNKIETTMKCINSIRELNRDCVYEIIIIDNGSTDETPRVFSSYTEIGAEGDSQPGDSGDRGKITYIRNDKNLGVAKVLNKGASVANFDILCFMHNDVFISQENWITSLGEFITNTANAGVVGLYGAKTIRKDGSFKGKSIIHAIKDNPTITNRFEKVAVVDGLLLAMSKAVFHKTKGFCDDFTVHYYDKDMSLRAYKNGFVNYVLNIPFEHTCATTRREIVQDDTIRDEAQKKFMEMWNFYLPLDVSTWREKIGYLVRKKGG
jgi:GT2 family glycosyltransferase